jgi:Ca2+-binding EF-hand superfamily protein
MTHTPRRIAFLGLLLTAVVAAPWLAATTAAQQPAKQPAAGGDVQDFVFLAQARPVLIRAHVSVDGKPVQAAFDGFIKHLFAHLDVNGDGVLSKEEAERAPPLDHILAGSPLSGLGALAGFGGSTAGPSFDDLDTDKDGKVTLAELTAYYKGRGLAPIQFHFDTKQGNPLLQFLGGGSREPSVGAIADAMFALLDTDHDGKLTPAELAAAPEVLLKKDENDDEMITPREVVVPTAAPAQFGPGMGGMMGGGPKGPGAGAANNFVVLLPAPGQAPAELVGQMQKRYGSKGAAADKAKLSRKDLGLDEATFAALDTNGDGVLDAAELAGFVKRTPDLEVAVRLGTKAPAQKRVQVLTDLVKGAPLAGKVKTRDHLALLELGVTRVELRTAEVDRPNRLAGLVRGQLTAQFKQADKDGNGYLDAKEAEASGLFRGIFKAMDRDGDGKVYEKEFLAYLDTLEDLQKRVRAGCVTLVLTDQSRGLFDLLDVDRDGRLSVREMRGATKLIEQLGCAGKGFLTKADLPSSYLLTLRRGTAPQQGGFDLSEAFEQLYNGSYEGTEDEYPTAGPLWFRKMDRNRDGDVSRKEFLGTDEQFRQIDTDGDGLISAEEAERYDAQFRNKK